MAASNPWTTDGGDGRYRVAVGGLQGFLSRNNLVQDDSHEHRTSSSEELIQRIERMRVAKEQVLQKSRELELLEAQLSASDCLHEDHLQQRLELLHSIGATISRAVSMKQVLLRTLQKNTTAEWMDIEIEYQRSFADLMSELGSELPRFQSHVDKLSAARGLATTTSQGSEIDALLTELKATIAMCQRAFDELGHLRNAYAKLRKAPEPGNITNQPNTRP